MKQLLIYIAILYCSSIQAQDKLILLNGVDAYIDLNSAILSTSDGFQPYTLEAWVKTSDGVDNCFISQYESVLPNGDRFQFEIRNNKLNWWKGAPNSQIRVSILSVSDINDNTWHHIAGTRDDSGNVTIYIDGILEGTGTDNYPFISTNTRIGTRNSAGGFVNAKMDEVRIWNISRSQNEIQQTMNKVLTGSESGLIGYWNFNDGTADDLTSNNNDGLIMGSLQFSEDDSPLPITLSSFSAIQTSNNFAQIQWTTQSETNLLGYNLYRNTEDSTISSEKINPQMIYGENSTSGSNYSFTDENVEYEQPYFYWLESVELSGNTDLFGPVSITLENPENQIPELPNAIKLQQNYPNPFNPSTTIEFSINENETGKLSIFNAKGQLLETENFSAGEHSYQWNADNLTSGIYFYKLQTKSFKQIKKMILLK